MLQVDILQNSGKTSLSCIEELLCAGTLHIRKLPGYNVLLTDCSIHLYLMMQWRCATLEWSGNLICSM